MYPRFQPVYWESDLCTAGLTVYRVLGCVSGLRCEPSLKADYAPGI